MKHDLEELASINDRLAAIIEHILLLELRYTGEIDAVHPSCRKSAMNLVHYLGLRSFDIADLQKRLIRLGLPSLANIEPHVLWSLLAVRNIINCLLGMPDREHRKGIVTINQSGKILDRNSRKLFGYRSKKRRTRIMVTLPLSAAYDKSFVRRLMKSGMNTARINCAHDTRTEWKKMVSNVHHASGKLNKRCRIMIDLAGPKLRTGPMQPGPKVIHIRPERDLTGNILGPVKVWIAPAGSAPPDAPGLIFIPVTNEWFMHVKRGDLIQFTDTRGKSRQILVGGRKGQGRWGYCGASSWLETGTRLRLFRPDGHEKQADNVGELLPLEQFITLRPGDSLILHADERPGEAARLDQNGQVLEPAHIACTLPEVFDSVRPGESIMFNDGKIEGIIREVTPDVLRVEITNARDSGSKLRADKGINLPKSHLSINILTRKDKQDLDFVCKHADAVNISFINTAEDVHSLLRELDTRKAKVGIILKIETRNGFRNLPRILLAAMQRYPVGVMVARGDLAIEAGWKNFASIQEEIVRICEAAHVPDIWATQVL
ncbi:MAG: pyruvate kinase, partial [Sedimenticolaceae bacterium]|nr:pyruvate kinase [Sedimenticolaceae bacterium]